MSVTQFFSQVKPVARLSHLQKTIQTLEIKGPPDHFHLKSLFDYNFLCLTFAYLSYIMKQEINIQERSVHIHTYARVYMNS